LLNSGAQEECAQVLLHGSWTDAEFGGNLFVAAPLYQQLQHLLVTPGNLNVVQVDHPRLDHFRLVGRAFFISQRGSHLAMHTFRQTFASPRLRTNA
jgi:hypothetical protein